MELSAAPIAPRRGGAPPVVDARAVAVGRGARVVLEGVDLAVARGERVALVGGNGSGKTTLLRALAGLDAPRAGSLAWSGRRLPRGAARAGALAVLFQGEPPPGFTVRHLVTLGLGLDGPPPLPARARVEAALARVGLEALADRRCDALSGGEWQRAALARATVASPALLLLDEPTNHLDPAHRAALLARLAEVAEEAAVVVATHDLELAAACDRVVLLGAGRVTALGAPDEVLTPERLAGALGVRVRRVPDPEGARPLLRVVGPA